MHTTSNGVPIFNPEHDAVVVCYVVNFVPSLRSAQEHKKASKAGDGHPPVYPLRIRDSHICSFVSSKVWLHTVYLVLDPGYPKHLAIRHHVYTFGLLFTRRNPVVYCSCLLAFKGEVGATERPSHAQYATSVLCYFCRYYLGSVLRHRHPAREQRVFHEFQKFVCV
jgi:hypothetical protein